MRYNKNNTHTHVCVCVVFASNKILGSLPYKEGAN